MIFRCRSTPVEKESFGESLTHFIEAVTEAAYTVKWRTAPWKLTVLQLSYKFIEFYGERSFINHNSSALDLILSHVNPVHNFPPNFFKIHTNIIPHPRQYLPSCLFPSVFPIKILYEFSTSPHVLRLLQNLSLNLRFVIKWTSPSHVSRPFSNLHARFKLTWKAKDSWHCVFPNSLTDAFSRWSSFYPIIASLMCQH